MKLQSHYTAQFDKMQELYKKRIPGTAFAVPGILRGVPLLGSR